MILSTVRFPLRLLSGRATFEALKKAVDEISRVAPQDHDVLIEVFDIPVSEVGFTEPHTLLLGGVDKDGHRTIIVAHYSQLVAKVI